MRAGMTDVLLEREAEIERARDLLADAAAGHGRVLMVEGEAGIGKSAVLEAVRRRALDAEFTVLRGRGRA